MSCSYTTREFLFTGVLGDATLDPKYSTIMYTHHGLVQQRARPGTSSAILSGLVVLEGFLSAPVLRKPYRNSGFIVPLGAAAPGCSTPLAVSNSHNIFQTLFRPECR